VERAAAGTQRTIDVDPRQGTLRHRHLRGTTQLGENVAEVGIVADDDRPDRVAGVAQEGLQGLALEGAGQPVVK